MYTVCGDLTTHHGHKVEECRKSWFASLQEAGEHVAYVQKARVNIRVGSRLKVLLLISLEVDVLTNKN